MKTVAGNIRAMRLAHNISQKEFASREGDCVADIQAV